MLSLPVYVVFFFTAGVGLPRRAAGHVALRAGALHHPHVRPLRRDGGGGPADPRPASLQRVGWMGFGAQAGIALSMAIAAGHSFGEVGLALETLAVAGVALNELRARCCSSSRWGWPGAASQGGGGDRQLGLRPLSRRPPALPPELMETQLGPDPRRLQEEMRRFRDLAHQLGERRRRLGRVHTELLRREFLHFQGAALASREQAQRRERRIAAPAADPALSAGRERPAGSSPPRGLRQRAQALQTLLEVWRAGFPPTAPPGHSPQHDPARGALGSRAPWASCPPRASPSA